MGHCQKLLEKQVTNVLISSPDMEHMELSLTISLKLKQPHIIDMQEQLQRNTADRNKMNFLPPEKELPLHGWTTGANALSRNVVRNPSLHQQPTLG